MIISRQTREEVTKILNPQGSNWLYYWRRIWNI